MNVSRNLVSLFFFCEAAFGEDTLMADSPRPAPPYSPAVNADVFVVSFRDMHIRDKLLQQQEPLQTSGSSLTKHEKKISTGQVQHRALC
mmetsp:Transcript_28899/g.47971  ORF Transcript_28899/g.47971 Transcript_28899/m.47971 type:complete len:89 (-) Transcript_28899:58-324(-)